MSETQEFEPKIGTMLWPDSAAAGSAELLWLDLARAANILERRPDGEELADALNKDPQAGEWTTRLGTSIAWMLARDPADPVTQRVWVDVSALLVRLAQPLLTGVLQAESEPLRRMEFLEHCATRLALPAALRVAAGFAALSGRPLSEPLKTILKRMAIIATSLPPDHRPEAEEPIRTLIVGLFTSLVTRFGRDVSGGFEPITHGLTFRAAGRAAPEAERVVQIAIEAEASGPAVFVAVEELTRQGISPVVEMMRRVPDENAVANAIMKRVATPQELGRLVTQEPLDEEATDVLVKGLGLSAARVMLDALADSRSRATRRYLLDRLAGMGPAIQPLVEARLKDNRWFVQRNMVALLRASGCPPRSGTFEQLIEHPDSRVRREVVLWLLDYPETKERAVSAGLNDTHPEVLRPALHAARSGMPQAAVPILSRRLLDSDFPPGSRVLAIGLLGRSGSALALDALFKFAVRGKTFLSKPKLAPKSPEMLAAVSALARTWRTDRTAAGLLAQAEKSRDPEILDAARTGSVEVS